MLSSVTTGTFTVKSVKDVIGRHGTKIATADMTKSDSIGLQNY